MKAVHADLRGVLVRAYVQPLMVAAIVCLLAFGLVTYGRIDGLIGRICVSVLAVLFFLVCIYASIATVAERLQIRELIQLAKSKITPNRKMPETN